MAAPSILDLAVRLRRGELSRNRNFEELAAADGAGERALRLCRFLRSLERDLTRRSPEVRLAVHPHGDGGRRLVIEVPGLRLRRVATLSAEEYGLLREHPGVRVALDD